MTQEEFINDFDMFVSNLQKSSSRSLFFYNDNTLKEGDKIIRLYALYLETQKIQISLKGNKK